MNCVVYFGDCLIFAKCIIFCVHWLPGFQTHVLTVGTKPHIYYLRQIIKAVSRSPTFGLCSSYAIGPERHVIAEGYMTRKLNFCLKTTLTLILTLRPSRRVS